MGWVGTGRCRPLSNMKKLLIVIGVILALGLALFFYLRDRKLSDFEPQIISRLAELVRNGTDSLYRLEIGNLEVDILNSRVTLLDARLFPDSAVLEKLDLVKNAPNEIIFLEVDRLNIEGITPAILLQNRVIELDTLIIQKPRIKVFHSDREYNQHKPVDTTPIDQKILAAVDRIKLNRLLIQQADFVHINLAEDNRETVFQQTTIDFHDILIDSNAVNDRSRILFAKEAQIRFSDYVFATGDSLYMLKAAAVFVSAARKELVLTDVSLKPRISKENFVKQSKELRELYTLNFKQISFHDVNWWQLLNEEMLRAQSAELKDGNLEVYCNRSLPPFSGSKVGNYPHQALMRVPLDIYISQMHISNFDIEYQEYNPNSEKTGVLSFTNASGTISNVTNNALQIETNKKMVAKAKAFLLGHTQVNASFSFDLARHKSGIFSVDMNIGKMDGTKLNKVTEPLGLFTLKSANIHSIAAKINGSDHSASGTVRLFYDDLKLVPLKADGEEGLKERGFLGFLANTFVVKSENLPNRDPRVSSPTYQRETNKSFFALIWKTLLSGLLESVGAPAKLAIPKELKEKD